MKLGVSDYRNNAFSKIVSQNPQSSLSPSTGTEAKKIEIDNKTKYNFAVCGESGVGKSTFINAIRGLDDDPTKPGRAKTGVNETTMDIQPYAYSRFETYILFWDVPGAGTLSHPGNEYFKNKHLGKFDCLLILSRTVFTEIDANIAREATHLGVPVAFVRTQADVNINSMVNNDEEADTAEEAAELLRKRVFERSQKTLQSCGLDDLPIFVICSDTLRSSGAPDSKVPPVDERSLVDYIKNTMVIRGPGKEEQNQAFHRCCQAIKMLDTPPDKPFQFAGNESAVKIASRKFGVDLTQKYNIVFVGAASSGKKTFIVDTTWRWDERDPENRAYHRSVGDGLDVWYDNTGTALWKCTAFNRSKGANPLASARAVEEAFYENTLEAFDCIVLVCCDATPRAMDVNVWSLANRLGVPILVLRNKVDKDLRGKRDTLTTRWQVLEALAKIKRRFLSKVSSIDDCFLVSAKVAHENMHVDPTATTPRLDYEIYYNNFYFVEKLAEAARSRRS